MWLGTLLQIFTYIILYHLYIYHIYTPCKHSLRGYIGIGLSVRLSGPTSTSFVRFPPNFVEFKIMMCELCSIKDFYCPLSFTPLWVLCLFGLRNFETIQYAHCHCKFSYMINQKFMKLCTLQDPNMKMCTLVGYPSPLRFTPVMLFWTSKFWDNSPCALSSQLLPHCLMRCLWSLVYCENLIWRCAH